MQNQQLEAADVLRKLNEKFSANLDKTLRIASSDVESIDISARAIAACASLLGESGTLTPTQSALCSATEEVFADVVTSVYLSAVGLDVSAQMTLRRAFELGLAVVYLWDLPHLYWGWKECDLDLSFTAILDHVSSPSYLTFVRRTAQLGESETLIDASAARRVYRKTSNTVHGKVTTHKVLAGDGFALNPAQVNEHLALATEVTQLVLTLWTRRFVGLKSLLHERLPACRKVIA